MEENKISLTKMVYGSAGIIVACALVLVGYAYFPEWFHKVETSQYIQKYTIRTYPVVGGFGYDILINNKTIVHQPIVPGSSVPFESERQALNYGYEHVAKMEISRDATATAVPKDKFDELTKKMERL